jgi:hypothetical protein
MLAVPAGRVLKPRVANSGLAGTAKSSDENSSHWLASSKKKHTPDDQQSSSTSIINFGPRADCASITSGAVRGLPGLLRSGLPQHRLVRGAFIPPVAIA